MKATILKSLALLSIIFVQAVAHAQPEDRVRVHEKLVDYKRTFLTEHLALTEKDSIKFWPIYDEFEKERLEIRKELMSLTKGMAAKSDDQLEKDITKSFSLKEDEMSLEKKYHQKFQKVLTIRQIAALYQAEHKMKRKLIEKIGKGHIKHNKKMKHKRF